MLRDFDLTNAGAWFERVQKRLASRCGLFYDRPPTIRLQGNGLLFLDAHEIAERDFGVVTRTF